MSHIYAECSIAKLNFFYDESYHFQKIALCQRGLIFHRVQKVADLKQSRGPGLKPSRRAMVEHALVI